MSIALDTFATGAPRCRLGFNAEYVERHGVQILGSYRAYNPVLMRFQNPDNQSPFARGGLNAYAYCHGDPVNFVDPTGHYALAPLTLRTLHWVAGAGLTTAVIASVAGLALKNGKSREIAFGIAAGGLAVGIAAVAAPVWVDGGHRVRVQAIITRLLQRIRPQRTYVRLIETSPTERVIRSATGTTTVIATSPSGQTSIGPPVSIASTPAYPADGMPLLPSPGPSHSSPPPRPAVIALPRAPGPHSAPLPLRPVDESALSYSESTRLIRNTSP